MTQQGKRDHLKQRMDSTLWFIMTSVKLLIQIPHRRLHDFSPLPYPCPLPCNYVVLTSDEHIYPCLILGLTLWPILINRTRYAVFEPSSLNASCITVRETYPGKLAGPRRMRDMWNTENPTSFKPSARSRLPSSQNLQQIHSTEPRLDQLPS